MLVNNPYLYSDHDYERLVDEGVKRRSPFDLDCARIGFSASFRRLENVTQVFGAYGKSTTRTRSSHSLEVAAIAEAIAIRVGVDPYLARGSALAHDLGHPPFGHDGEKVLDALAVENSLDGYEGNAQVLRLLSVLEEISLGDGISATRPCGLNLTRAFLDATIKYPWFCGQVPGRKFGVYDSELEKETFQFVRGANPSRQKSVEAQIMDCADDFAYATHDFEDGIAEIIAADIRSSAKRTMICQQASTGSGVLNRDAEDAYERLMAMPMMQQILESRGSEPSMDRRLVKKLHGSIIDHFVDETVAATQNANAGNLLGRHSGTVVVPPKVRAEVEVLKAITWLEVIQGKRITAIRQGEQARLHELSESLLRIQKDVLVGKTSRADVVAENRDPLFSGLWHRATAMAVGLDEREQTRRVIDAVAVLTDQSAEELHRGLITRRAAHIKLGRRVQAGGAGLRAVGHVAGLGRRTTPGGARLR